MPFEKIDPNSDKLDLSEAQNEANMVKVITAESSEGKELTAEDYERAFKYLEELIDGLESDKSALGVIGKYSGKLLNVFGVFPNSVTSILEAVLNASQAIPGEKKVPLGEGLRKAFEKVRTDFKRNEKFLSESQFEKELERLQEKADKLDQG